MSISSVQLADALGQPRPTDEQQQVIEAPPRPLLVIAGAGSGKTETMAARVVWLIANAHIQADQVLGLTFTRKAAAELGERVIRRLRRLRATGLWSVPEQLDGAEVLGGTPTVSTYHAYAGRLVREHGLLLGIEPDFRLLTEAATWQLAAEVVESYDGPMELVDKAAPTVTAAVVDLAAEMAEHLVEREQVDQLLRAQVEWVRGLPATGRSGNIPASLRAALATLEQRRQILPIVERYQVLKRARDVLDFADQMALAAWLAIGYPEVCRGERSRFAAVLLDEFQDTSEAQLALLRALYADPGEQACVTAVGDPHQSIYGWRGASAGALARFPPAYAGKDGPAGVLPLSTSWRNDAAVLQAADALVAPLRRQIILETRTDTSTDAGTDTSTDAGTDMSTDAGTDTSTDAGTDTTTDARTVTTTGAGTRTQVGAATDPGSGPRLGTGIDTVSLVARPGAGAGRVEVARLLTVEDEAAHVARWLAAYWWDEHGEPTALTAAVLCRKRSAFAPVVAALTEQGLPVEVVGIGGLIDTPEVGDIVALLHAVQDPTRGDQLMRLLAGPTCRIGAADLDGLATWARLLFARDNVPPRAGVRDLAVQTEGRASLVEALDELPDAEWVGPHGERIGSTALLRLGELAELLRRLRGLTGVPLPELVAGAERALGLDVEVLARGEHTTASARAHLDAFGDVAADFAACADRPTLTGFLAWLDAARSEERGLDTGAVESAGAAVQVLTVHAAKGLEWDVVAVPALVDGTFPDRAGAVATFAEGRWSTPPVTAKGWCTGLGALPYPLRGDRDALPHLAWDAAADLQCADRALGEFFAACGQHRLAEERRLAYVASTRARRALLLTASVWSEASTPRLPSPFLAELVQDGTPSGPVVAAESLRGVVRVGPWVPMPEPVDGAKLKNPRTGRSGTTSWPYDAYARRRPAVLDAASAVLAALRAPAGAGIQRSLDLGVPVPVRISRRDRRLAVPVADAELGAAGSPAQLARGTPFGEADQNAGDHRQGQVDRQGQADRRGQVDQLDQLDQLDERIDVLLADRLARERRIDAPRMPAHLSASALVELARDPRGFALELRRPVPRPPADAARRGTSFHAWVEHHYRRAAILDVLDLPGSADGQGEPSGGMASLEEMRGRFLVSPWAARDPIEVELSLETVIDKIAVRCRIDAVFRRLDGGWTIVDWKTGRRPHGTAASTAALQLATYRYAFCRLRELPSELVDAAFYYAASGETVWPELPGEGAVLEVLARGLPGELSDPDDERSA